MNISSTESATSTSSGPAAGKFFNSKDLLIALSAELVICAPAGAASWYVVVQKEAGAFVCLVTFWLVMMATAIVFLKILRTVFPMRPGIYSYLNRPVTTYVWTLNSFICATNLGILYNHPSLMPSPIKKIFYQMLGARLGKGQMMIGGRLTDPHLITIEAGAVIGGDCCLLAHAMTRFDSNVLILQPILIRSNSIVGAYTLIMPGVTVGQGATIRAMSYVSMNTSIPAGENWAGNPAVRRPSRATTVTAS